MAWFDLVRKDLYFGDNDPKAANLAYQQQMQAQVPEGMPTSSGEFNKEMNDEPSQEINIEQENRIAAAAAQAGHHA